MSIVQLKSDSICLHSAYDLPLAGSYLWNHRMMFQINCQGYANAQFLQPEPASYAAGPILQATSFMQPEQPIYSHHPGRFFYIKDQSDGRLSSIPHAPIKSVPDSFEFEVSDKLIEWRIEDRKVRYLLQVHLDPDLVVEHWQLSIENLSKERKSLSIYPYFPIGYHSWMNQSASYEADATAIVSKRVSPYQKTEDYFAQKNFNELTFLMAEREPDSWDARQAQFEGSSGLHRPSGVELETLQRGDALYETPCAAMQYCLKLESRESSTLRFAFGAAQNTEQLVGWRSQFFADTSLQNRPTNNSTKTKTSFEQTTPCANLDNFVNLWLPRQIRYHNDLQRLSTDPQTRNFLQDTMGLVFLNPERAKQNLLLALAQQNSDGSMPDGILLHADAKLKYINQIPHADQAVWLVIAVHCYLRESNDMAWLEHTVVCRTKEASIYSRVSSALAHLASARDARGLSYIQQGDWCDPMNMVGHNGKGVSIWLTLATAYAAGLWSDICARIHDKAAQLRHTKLAEECNNAVNLHAWDDDWYARGITDDGRVFGIKQDTEGKIFLNPQSWALLANTADDEKKQRMLAAVSKHLTGPWGVELLTPAFTNMVEDIGRVTQKFPGTAENGSVYNHAAAFYAYALFQENQPDMAFDVLQKMLPQDNLDDLRARGQLPNFIPNYYRGAHRQHPRTAGRSSQLVHTGTINWYLMCLIEGLFGLQGKFECLEIKPQLPSTWSHASCVRRFGGAVFKVDIRRDQSAQKPIIILDGKTVSGNKISDIQMGHRYRLEILMPLEDTAMTNASTATL